MTGDHALWLGGAVTAVLLVASITSTVLKARIANGQPHAVIDNLIARVRSWWILSAILGSALWAGIAATFMLFALVSMAALREYLTAPLPASYHRGRPWASGLIICVVCIAPIPALLMLEIPGYEGRNVFLLVFLVLVAQASDVLQYLWGKWLGKHPIAPIISPAKTVEGFVGGIICATLLGAGLWQITPFSLLQAAVIALLITLLGFAGGLILSAQKRARGIKDWSNLIRGHGGMLDRIDSLWLSAPVFYCAVWLGWARTG